MKIKCTSNQVKDLAVNYQDLYRSDLEDYLPIKLHSDYVVYALAIYKGMPWYYIIDHESMYYPLKYPALLFRVIDYRISQYWIYNFTVESRDHAAIFTFAEWALEPYYYDKLTDKEDNEVNIFFNMKRLMDAEAEI